MTISSGRSLPYLWVLRNVVPHRSCSTIDQLRLPFLHPMILRLSLVPWYPRSLVLALTSRNKFSFRHFSVFFFSWSTTSSEGNYGSPNFLGTRLMSMLWSRTPVELIRSPFLDLIRFCLPFEQKCRLPLPEDFVAQYKAYSSAPLARSSRLPFTTRLCF